MIQVVAAIQLPIPEPPNIISTSKPINSPGLQVQQLGDHTVTVSVDVLPQPTMPNLLNAVGKVLGSLMPIGTISSSGGGAATSTPTGPSVAEAQSLLNTLAPTKGNSLPLLKVCVLYSSNHVLPGLGAVQYVNKPLQLVISQLAGSIRDPCCIKRETL